MKIQQLCFVGLSLFLFYSLLDTSVHASKTNEKFELDNVRTRKTISSTPKEKGGQEILSEGFEAFTEGKFEEAKKIYHNLHLNYSSTLGPENYVSMGRHFYEMGSLKDAWIFFKQAFQSKTDFPWRVDYVAGRSAYGSGEKKEALSCFQKALTKSGKKPWDVFAMAGRTALDLNKVNADTLTWLKTSLKLTPEDNPERWRIEVDAARAAVLLKEHREVQDFLQNAFKRSSKSVLYLQEFSPEVLVYVCQNNEGLKEKIHQGLFYFFEHSPDQTGVRNVFGWVCENLFNLCCWGPSQKLLKTHDKLTNPNKFYKRSSPYWLYNHVQKKRQEKVNWGGIQLIQETILGRTVLLRPAFFQKMPPPRKLTFKDLPPSSPTFFEDMTKEVQEQGHDDLLSVGTYDYFQRLLSHREPSEEGVPLIQLHLSQLVEAIKSQSSKAVDKNPLSPQQYQFLKLLKALKGYETQSGKHVCIMRLYNDWIVPEGVKKAKTWEDKVRIILRAQVEEMFYGDNDFTRELMGLKPKKFVNNPGEQGRYLRNVLGPLVGLEDGVEFYLLYQQSSKKLVYTSKTKLLQAFYQHFKPSALVKALEKKGFTEEKALEMLINMDVVTATEPLEEGWEEL